MPDNPVNHPLAYLHLERHDFKAVPPTVIEARSLEFTASHYAHAFG